MLRHRLRRGPIIGPWCEAVKACWSCGPLMVAQRTVQHRGEWAAFKGPLTFWAWSAGERLVLDSGGLVAETEFFLAECLVFAEVSLEPTDL
jgi:hypothetical protein